MKPLTDQSDRMVLTVRCCSDGTREWLSADGGTALVFFERARWWSQFSKTSLRTEHDTELEALDALLNPKLAKQRKKVQPDWMSATEKLCSGGCGYAGLHCMCAGGPG
jgi:hypothetical protein